jgi:hypothetical protein
MNKNPVNPVILSKSFILSDAEVANTGCPIAMLILQNEPNYPRFQPKNRLLWKKQSQNKPNSNPIYLGEAQRRRNEPKLIPPGQPGLFIIIKTLLEGLI